MKRLLAIVAAAVGMGVRAEVATNVWIGDKNGSLEWAASANWSLGHIPTSSERILITNTTAQAISTSTYQMRISRISVSGANHSLALGAGTGGLYYYDYTGEDKDSFPTGVIVEVPSGITFTINANGRQSYNDQIALHKYGKGTWVCQSGIGDPNNDSYKRYKALNVWEGAWSMPTPNRNITVSKIKVADGASCTVGGSAGRLYSACEIDVQKGGVFTLNANNTIARLFGAGAVKGSGVLTLSLAGGPCGFSGTIANSLVFNVASYVAGTTEFVCSNASVVGGVKYSAASGTTLSDVFKVWSGLGRVSVPIANTPNHTLTYDDGGAVTYARYIAAGSSYTHTASGDDHWTDPVYGGGTIIEKSAGTWTIDSISLTGGSFQVSSEATGRSVVFGGGTMTNGSFQVSKGGYTSCFDGVNLKTSTQMLSSDDRFYRQTAGNVWLGGLNASGSSGSWCLNEIYYYISGGSLTIQPNQYWQQGLGLEASGSSDVTLRNGSYNSAVNIPVLSHGTHGYTLRIRDNARVHAEGLLFHYYKGGAATSRVEVLDQALFEVSGKFGASEADYLPASAAYRNFLTFDGGTMRTTSSAKNVDWPNVYQAASQTFISTVGERGLTVDVPSDFGLTRVLNWYGSFSSGGEDGSDGGISLTGYGKLRLISGQTDLKGPIRLEHNTLAGDGADARAFGTGPVVMSNAVLEVATASGGASSIASDTSSTVTFAGNSVIRKNAAGTLTIGSSGRVSPPFVRGDRGFLTLLPRTQSDFSTFRYRVPTGLELSAAGVSSLPIFALVYAEPRDAYGYDRGAHDVRLVSCDANGYVCFKQGASTNAIPSDASLSTVLYEHLCGGLLPVAKDAMLGAMEIYGGYGGDVCGVTVNAGVRLQVGVGAGKTAPVMLNNMMNDGSANGVAQIVGEGTLDFGAAAGIFVVNAMYAENQQQLVSCRIAGTGGVSIHSPCVVDLNDVNSSGYQISPTRGQTIFRAISVTGDNTYSGGTYVDNAIVLPGQATSLGTGTVTLNGERYRGGELHFGEDYAGGDFANALVLSGSGFYYAGDTSTAYGQAFGTRAALSSKNKSVKLTGPITLEGDATVAVSGTGRMTLTGAVTGTGTLRVTEGTVVVRKEAIDAYHAGKIVAEGSGSVVELRSRGFIFILDD